MEIERLNTVFGEAYQHLLEEDSEISVLNDLCAGVADVMALPFIWIERRVSDAIMVPVATSSNGPLHNEVHRLPARDDDSILGEGPSAQAMRRDAPVLMDVQDEGFAPWRKAAEAQGVKAVLAVPVMIRYYESEQLWAVMFCAENAQTLSQWQTSNDLQTIVRRIGRVCEALCRYRQQLMVFRAMMAAGNAAFITDSQGTILWANPAFGRLSGHPIEDVVGQNPRILKSGKQGYRYYDRLWRTISGGSVWSGETIERDSAGELYTVRQTISPVKTGRQITHYISVHDDISTEKALREARERAQVRDQVTGLMTAATFSDRLERAVEFSNNSGQPLALLMLGIKEFQTLMGSLGPDIEELVLQTMGDRIHGSLQDDDFAAYLGDGDFSIVLRESESIREAQAMGERILEVLDEPFPLLGDKLYLSREMGVAFLPDDATDADGLIRVADARAGGVS